MNLWAEKAKNELELDLEYLEEALNKLENDKTFRQAEIMLEKFQEKGKKSLLEAPLFEFFLTSCALLNDKYSYKEIESILKPIENNVNAWNVNNISIMNEIEKEYRESSNNPAKKHIHTEDTYKKYLKLGLTEKTLSYNVISSFCIIGPIISFRNRVDKCLGAKSEVEKEKIIEKMFTYSNVALVLETIENYMKKEQENRKERKKYIKNGIEALKKFRKEVENGILFEITEIPNYINPFLSPNTLEPIYYLFNLTLQKENKSLDNQIEMHEQVLSDPIMKLLYENNINPDLIEKTKLERLRKMPFSLLEIGIKSITLLGLPKIELLNSEENILENLDYDSLDTITYFYNNGILTGKTMQNNLLVLTSDAKKLITNYEILKDIMEFKSQYYDDSVLLLEPSSLKERLSVLAEYSLTKNDYIFLLCHYEYIGIYDLVLEQNIPIYLFIQICKTQKPILTIKRICLYILLDIPYKTAQNLLMKEVKEESFFLCCDAALDMYLSLIDAPKEEGSYIGDIKNANIVRTLDETYRIENIYCFKDTIVSRPKFLKKLQSIQDNGKDIEIYVNQCLLADSLVTERTILDIKKGMKKISSTPGL